MYALLVSALLSGQVDNNLLGGGPTYSQAMSAAINNQQPLVVGIGCEAPVGGDWGVTTVDPSQGNAWGAPVPSLIVSVPDGQGWMAWVKTLPPDATYTEIQSVIRTATHPIQPRVNTRRVSRIIPFLQEDVKTARLDADQLRLVSLWPQGVEIPPNLRTYKGTKWTQRLVIQNNAPNTTWHPVGANDPVVNASIPDPNRQFPWAVPGGLHADSGWESILATNVDNDYIIHQTRMVPVAGSSQLLPRRTWIYPNNAIFADILAYNGKPFTIRTLTKINNQWVPRTPYVDMSVAPPNFHGAGKACQECHSKAGTNEQYGISIRGWDGIFSYNPLQDHK